MKKKFNTFHAWLLRVTNRRRLIDFETEVVPKLFYVVILSGKKYRYVGKGKILYYDTNKDYKHFIAISL